KSAGTGSTTMNRNVSFNNAVGGVVNVLSGTLALGYGTSAGESFGVSSGAVLDLTNGASETFTGTYTGSGGGPVQLSRGTLNVGAGGATFNFPGGMFQWTGGVIDTGSNTLTNAGALALAGDVYLVGTLTNTGTITQTRGNLNFHAAGVALNNQAGALFDV